MPIARLWLAVCFLSCLVGVAPGAESPDAGFEVTLTTNEAPHLREWGEDARRLMIEWRQRIDNLIPTPGYEPPKSAELVIRDSQEGVAFASGDKIVVSSHWIEKHPEDIGLVVHELVHVIQAYPRGAPFWLTEGIADYLRWAIYEGKPAKWFPRNRDASGYRQGYRVAGGFLLWLETHHAPGIVNRLNQSLRAGDYRPELFEETTGKQLDALWDEYAGREEEATPGDEKEAVTTGG